MKLDWELSTLGHPIGDLAYFCVCLRLPQDGSTKGLAGIDREQLGIPSEKEVIEQYCRLRDMAPIESWGFYLAFSLFRLTAITQGVLKRALDGNASSDQALQVGKAVPFLAEMAMAIINEEN
jgi:aminoglycoside phosphotransferase (APT) family kinase protein